MKKLLLRSPLVHILLTVIQLTRFFALRLRLKDSPE